MLTESKRPLSPRMVRAIHALLPRVDLAIVSGALGVPSIWVRSVRETTRVLDLLTDALGKA